MTAAILPFPAPPNAKVIPITAAPRRKSITELATEAVISNYEGALRGDERYRQALEMMARSHANCAVARLAGELLASLDGNGVTAPCDSGDVA